jgi:hypothetical protein
MHAIAVYRDGVPVIDRYTEPLELADERETARFLRISSACLRRWRARGEGPPWLRVGERLVRYDLAAVQHWLKGQTEGPREQ